MRNPIRRLRGRLAAPVTLWTSVADQHPSGLTIASTLIVDGEPGRVFGAVDPDSDLYDAIVDSGRFTVQLLAPQHRDLADRFAGVAPAPGGPFRGGEKWRDTEWGPVLRDVGSWAGCRYVGSREAGWSHLVEGVIDHCELGPDTPLLYYRGRYHSLHTAQE